jgi:hypothetical protein
LLNDILSCQFSATIFFVLVNAFVVSFFVSGVLLLERIFRFGVFCNFFNVFKEIVNVLCLSQLLKDTLLVGLKHLLLIFDHLAVLVVVVAENVIYLFDGQSSIYSFDVLQLGSDEVTLTEYFIHKVVGGHILTINNHVIYQIELQEGDQLPVQRVQRFRVLFLHVFRLHFYPNSEIIQL